jgi:hypothetical protein
VMESLLERDMLQLLCSRFLRRSDRNLEFGSYSMVGGNKRKKAARVENAPLFVFGGVLFQVRDSAGRGNAKNISSISMLKQLRDM